MILRIEPPKEPALPARRPPPPEATHKSRPLN